MTASQFRRRVKALALTSHCIPACRDVLVGGQTAYAAAKTHSVDKGQLSRLLKQIREAEPVCRTCGQRVA